MGQFLQFAEILENKIRNQLKDEFAKQYSHPDTQSDTKNNNNCKVTLNTSEQLDWNLLLSLKKQAPMTQKKSTGPAYKTPAKKAKPAHTLSEIQQKSYLFFIHNNCELPAGYTESELRQAFRTLALKLHPDHGGTAYAIRELLEHRDVLSTVLATK